MGMTMTADSQNAVERFEHLERVMEPIDFYNRLSDYVCHLSLGSAFNQKPSEYFEQIGMTDFVNWAKMTMQSIRCELAKSTIYTTKNRFNYDKTIEDKVGKMSVGMAIRFEGTVYIVKGLSLPFKSKYNNNKTLYQTAFLVKKG